MLEQSADRAAVVWRHPGVPETQPAASDEGTAAPLRAGASRRGAGRSDSYHRRPPRALLVARTEPSHFPGRQVPEVSHG